MSSYNLGLFNLCRNVVAEQFKKRGKMGGKGLIVQIN